MWIITLCLIVININSVKSQIIIQFIRNRWCVLWQLVTTITRSGYSYVLLYLILTYINISKCNLIQGILPFPSWAVTWQLNRCLFTAKESKVNVMLTFSYSQSQLVPPQGSKVRRGFLLLHLPGSYNVTEQQSDIQPWEVSQPPLSVFKYNRKLI